MKKIVSIALSLSLVLSMGVAALAADAPIEGNTYAPGSTISLDATKFVQVTAGDPVAMDAIDRDNYSISTEWNIGGAMVDDVRINDTDGDVLITLQENYTIDTAKDLEGTITLRSKADHKTEYAFVSEGEAMLSVSNRVEDVEGMSDAEDADEYSADLNNTIYVCGNEYPGYVAFNSGSTMLKALLKMDRDEEVFMFIDEDQDDDVEDKYNEDGDYDFYYFAFAGSPSLQNEATLSIDADYFDEVFVYENVDGTLRAVNAELNEEDNTYEWSTKKLASYVVSAEKVTNALAAGENVAADEEDNSDSTEQNPDTGANDIVGVASALAVVSLIAAGAVIIKRK